ncbi:MULTISPECIES: glycosyltransferase family 25 protein [Acinetobacter]|uniref:glycosyltransferase family 25 protein n=1 Tax=Acinetobacter TaxID=469 RepID=UPI000C47B5EF|nr:MULTISPECIES: glycosyltransferase family 25 protein [Acinetobacter]MBC67557.1 glycosyltransferase [Acinetobacter sp.]MBT49039.1 glycosyltransferase [Acinetobacter sp.]HIQ36005.1 glycosyltransferase [Acinetobacter venetianus]HJP47156.1 glycosyltransferase family 25 protein [Acinetobacter venetianus]
MENFVISLKSAFDRRVHIEDQFMQQGIDFSFFDAIEPQQVENLAEQLAICISNCHLSQGELGCLFSHVLLWKKAIDDNIDYVAIFEDDIYLGERANDFLLNSQWIKDRWEILKLEKNSKFNYLSINNKLTIENGRVISKLLNANFGTAGYILSNKAAKSLFNYVKELASVDHIDQIMFKKYLQDGEYSVYQMNPALCIQEYLLYPEAKKFKSSLSWRNTEKVKEKNLLQKVKRELIRAFLQLYRLPFKVKIKFK